jgi:drug/metabolite transporter (DMT)-like permease
MRLFKPPACVAPSPAVGNPLYGIGFMILMTVCFASLDASAKYLSGELPLLMVLWGRYTFHFVFVMLFFVKGAPREIITTRRLKLQLLRSFLIFGAGVTFWGALTFMPLADCVVIAFASPLFVTVLSVPFLGERVGRHRWAAVIVGLVGVVLAARPGAGVFHWASFLPVVAALCYSIVQITTRILSRSDSTLTTLFYTSFGGLVLSVIAVLFVWVTPSPGQWLLLVWLGLLGALGHYLMIKAFEWAPASLLAPFDYTTLIWATLLGFILFQDLPDIWTVMGAVIIISSGIYLVRRESGNAAARHS